MKALVIPDIHLKPFIFSRAKEIMNKKEADIAVCLMDIPDDWGKEHKLDEYVETYDEAISFAKEFPQSLWCYGNHDLCYLWNERESGYSEAAKIIVQEKLMELNRVLPVDNPVKYIQCIDNVLFCHGGITEYFVGKYVPISMQDDVLEVVSRLNMLGHREMWNDDSPIWYRPQYYLGKMYGEKECLQVVGHTPVEKINRCGNVISCDVFSTRRDGSHIGTRELMIIDTKTWEFQGVR